MEQRAMATRKNAMRKKYAPTLWKDLVRKGKQNV
jgi:hypothetical protein